jgi:hypothetical protein
MMTSKGIIGYPHPVMAGLDPAIQPVRAMAVWRRDWMAASMAGLNPAIRAAMTRGGSLAGGVTHG